MSFTITSKENGQKNGREEEKPILAVCGKGGVGKTAFSALLARALLLGGKTPLLLVDADPAGGLVPAIGETFRTGLAGVRERLIRSVRDADGAVRDRIAGNLDYMVMEALEERKGYAFLAMGRESQKGCFCPANSLLRDAIELLAAPFATVLIDAEAGLEQISREVTRRVTRVLAVSDGSKRGADTVAQILDMIGPERVEVVLNRAGTGLPAPLPRGLAYLAEIPEDPEVKRRDQAGMSLWGLPDDNPALEAARAAARRLGLLEGIGGRR
jgi:CO dehydrogenase maturation factor